MMRKFGWLCSLAMSIGLALGAGARDGRIGLSSIISPAEAQQTSPANTPATPAVTNQGNINADQARQTLDVLQNDAKRNQLIQVLQTIANAPSATPGNATVGGSGTPSAAQPAAAPAANPPAT